MATDIKAGLPIRSEADGTDERVQVKVVDSTNPDTQQQTVDADGNAHIEMHGNRPDGSTDQVMRLSQLGAPNADGVYDASDNTKPAGSGVVAQTRNATASDTRQVERPTAKRGTSDTTDVSLDVSVHDGSGNAYTKDNPMPVEIVDEVGGTAVHDYQVTEDPVVAAGTGVITYTNGANPLTLKRIVMSASGFFKADIKTGPSGTLVQRYTVFNSAAEKNILLPCPKDFIIAATHLIEITFTNEDQQPFDCYATIEGMEE